MTCLSFFGPRWKRKPFILWKFVLLSGSLAEVLFWSQNSEAGTVCYGQVGTWKKWKKISEERPLLSSYRWSSWICTGRPVSQKVHGFFWQWLLVETKRKGVTLVDFHGRPTNLSPLQKVKMGLGWKHRETHGVLDGIPPKKGAPENGSEI